MVNAKIDPKKPPLILTMGVGAVIHGTTEHGGMPALFLCPASKPGVLDSDASAELLTGPVSENAVLIRFATAEAVLAHLDLVKAMVDAIEEGRS